MTISTDPRHAFIENAGVSFTAKAFSQWPEPLGLAALRDADAVREFADIARQEYVAVGIRAALHPHARPRHRAPLGPPGRHLRPGPGARRPSSARPTSRGSSRRCSARTASPAPRSTSPAAARSRTARTPHFPYGREQVYPGGRFADHLAPFPAVIEAGTAAVMPYYGMPVGLEVDGEPIEEVGFGFNAQVVTGMLREQLGYDGVVLTDWELVNDNHVGDQVLPARAWGVEHLDPHERMERILAAGADQFGGEECVEVLLDLVAQGRVAESRDRRVGPAPARGEVPPRAVRRPVRRRGRRGRTVGREDFRAAGYEAQARSVTVLTNGDGCRSRPPARGWPAASTPRT